MVIGLAVAGLIGGGLVLQGIYNGRRAHRRLAELAERTHGVVVAGDQAAPAVAIEVPEGRIVVGPTRAFPPPGALDRRAR